MVDFLSYKIGCIIRNDAVMHNQTYHLEEVAVKVKLK